MVISWILIIIGMVLLIVFLKISHSANIVKVLVIMAFLLLIGFSMFKMFETQKTDLSSPREIANTVYMYFGWLGNTATKLWDVGKDTIVSVGNVIKIDEANITVEEIDWDEKKETVLAKIKTWLNNIGK